MSHKPDLQKLELLVQIARLYYEQGMNQKEISDKIHLSRSYVSKLLDEARAAGVVEVRINDPVKIENRMERKLREYYNLKHVAVVPKENSVNWLQQVGKVTAEYLDSIVKDGDTIGFTWGETVYECAKALNVRDDIKGVTVLQLCGGISNTKRNVYVSEIVNLFAKAYNGIGYILPFPAIVSTRETRKLLDNEFAMKEVTSRVKEADIVVMTMSNLHPKCTMVRAGYLREDEIRILREKGAVGDICTHIINKEGRICDKELDDRTVAIPLNDIVNIDTRIGVAIGDSKVETTLAALEGGIINVLVTNDYMVEMLKAAKPEIFE